MKELYRAEIPQYLTQIKVSDARPYRIYTHHMEVPKKYQKEDYDFNTYGVLVNRHTDEVVLANPNTAGKPKFRKINGRDIYTGRVSPTMRAKILREMKAFYFNQLPNIRRPILHACKLKLDIYNIVEESVPELDNMSLIIIKVLQDVLVQKGILPKKNREVLKGFEVNYFPIVNTASRKLIITLEEFQQQLAMEVQC